MTIDYTKTDEALDEFDRTGMLRVNGHLIDFSALLKPPSHTQMLRKELERLAKDLLNLRDEELEERFEVTATVYADVNDNMVSKWTRELPKEQEHLRHRVMNYILKESKRSSTANRRGKN